MILLRTLPVFFHIHEINKDVSQIKQKILIELGNMLRPSVNAAVDNSI